MAKPVTLARGNYHQAVDPIMIEADPDFKDEIAMRKFWIMRTHSKKYRIATRLSTYLWFQGLNISNSKQEKYLNIRLLA